MKRDGKRVMVVGQSGITKQEYLENVVKQEYVEESQRRKMTLFNVGDKMYKEAEQAGGKIGNGKILELPLLRLSMIRRSVFKDIIHYCEKNPDENILVNTHSCFRWKRGLFHSFDFDLLAQLNPDLYIVLIDDVDAIFKRLNERLDPHVAEFSLKDILIWREEEMITTEMIARAQSKPYFIVPRNNPIDTIYKLMFQDHLKKAYLSFPITKVLDKPDILKGIGEFRKTLAKHLIVFDPYTIQEKRLLLKMKEAEQANQKEIEVDTLGVKLKFTTEDLKSIERDIDGQIISRDFNLINQSDMIVALIPEVKGEADISAGVQSEIQYAHDLPRDVHVIWPSTEEPSVWVNAMATEVFKGDKAFEEALQFMKKENIVS